MKQLLFYLSLSLFLTLPFSSCNDDELAPGKLRQPRTALSVVLLNKDGDDLLDPETGIYDAEDIKVYYPIDGKEVLRANPDGVYLYKGCPNDGIYSDSIYYVTLSVIDDRTLVDNHTTAIVKWNKTEADTVVCEVNPDYFDEPLKVYINGELVWDWSTIFMLWPMGFDAGVCLIK